MFERFEVGEIARLVDDGMRIEPGCPDYTGQDVEITEGLTPDPSMSFGWRYSVRCRDGFELEVSPSCLRKRRPPPDWVKLCNLTDIPGEVCHV